MTIVIPNHNEPRIGELTKRIALLFPEADLVVVNDPYGQGEGLTLWRGCSHVKSLPVVFLDGDLDIDPIEINKLLPYADKFDIVVGKKQLPRKISRKLLTLFSRAYIRLFFGLKVDTQTGLKLFNYVPDWMSEGWAFDIEVLYRAKKMGKTIKEVPIKAVVSDSKGFKAIWTTFIESLRIWCLLS